MRKEDLIDSPGQIELLKRLDVSLSVEQFIKEFPLLLRSLSVISKGGNVVCEPQSGEHYRFGVYFYALPDGLGHEDFVYKGRSFVLVPSEEIMIASKINDVITKRGIAVQPSKYYQRLVDDESQGVDLGNVSKAMVYIIE